MFYNNSINHAVCGPIPVGSTQFDLSKHERIYISAQYNYNTSNVDVVCRALMYKLLSKQNA